jgi:hypothetical protein
LVNCSDGEPLPEEAFEPADSTAKATYDAADKRYVLPWKTDRAWSGTCRVLRYTAVDLIEREEMFTFR